jgi:hypothetical protein
LPITEGIGEVPAHAEQDNLRFIVSPLEGVRLGHKDEREQTQSLTLPPAVPVFATQPDLVTYPTII